MADPDGMKALDAKVSATQRKLTLLAFFQTWWPFLVFIGTFMAIALAGGFDRMNRAAAAVTTLIFLAGSVVFIVRGWRRFTPASRADAAAMLDRQSDLRPVSSLTDRPADPSRGAYTLWQKHRARLYREIERLNPPSLKADWQRLDPYRMRLIVPSLIVLMAIIAGPDIPGRLKRAFFPDYGALVGADNMVVEAWITPPEHTGRAPIFLKPGLNDVRVPEGSEVTLRTEAPTAPKLVLHGEKTRRQIFEATPDGAYEARAKIMEDTRLSVNWWGERASWQFLASPDDSPSARFVKAPQMGRQDRTEFTWFATDDYGVNKLELVIRLQEPNPAAPEAEDRVPVPLPGTFPTEVTETTQLDLTRHRWAGLPVKMRLVATDGAGQQGMSDELEFKLPEKLFLDPIARVAQEVRVTVLREPRDYEELPKNDDALIQGAVNTQAANRLDAAPPDIQKAALMLDAMTYKGERYLPDQGVYLTFRTAEGILSAAGTKAEAEQVDPLLWALALRAEYGSAADALRRLEAARRALEQALRDGASEDEIRQRMEAFRDAANEYLAARMAEAMANGGDAPQMPMDGEASAGAPNLGGQDFEDMLNALQDLTETGATDQARQLLSDITNMLQNLEFQKGGSGSGGMPGLPGQQADGEKDDLPPEEQELTDAMRRLSEILREQRQLNDDTLAQQRGERPGESGQSQQGGQEPGQQPGQQGAQPGQDSGQPGGGESSGGQTAAPGGEGQEGGERPGSGTGAFAETDERGQGAGEGESLAERQARLGRLVEEFARQNGLGEGAGGENALEGKIDPNALEAIRRAQRGAEDALQQGDEGRATLNQERATNGLSDVARDLAQSLDALQQERTGQDAAESDPFGRPAGGAGNSGEQVTIPDQTERQRAKDILEELRRRYNQTDDEEEREYLRRLLDRF
ncbi:DUF4175 domain-containing protein [Hyphomonas pacifica]|uniref:TIGR02302 family protein n=1 Tax=Hyphomonas pacifica TaxID=1280941 RepID=A0A8B2PUR3_9PROT|nr:DUF4175 family protein [Hyphomonas pacifica]RAN32782.1 hypothetical protein HY3_14130 [Hyphomonas pacifica]